MFAFSAFARPHTDYYFILLSDALKRLRFPMVIVFDYSSVDHSRGGLTRKHVYTDQVWTWRPHSGQMNAHHLIYEAKIKLFMSKQPELFNFSAWGLSFVILFFNFGCRTAHVWLSCIFTAIECD